MYNLIQTHQYLWVDYPDRQGKSNPLHPMSASSGYGAYIATMASVTSEGSEDVDSMSIFIFLI